MDIKFTDRHVREYPLLTEQAITYLRSYKGEFEPILAARTLLFAMESEDDLPVGVIRMVLNTMRTDANVAAGLPVLFAVPAVLSDPPRIYTPAPRTYQEDNVVHHYPFDLKTRWHKEFYAATAKRATACHLLNHVKSTIRYYPRTKEFQVRLYSYCGPSLATGILLDAKPEDRHMCKACVSMREMMNDTKKANDLEIQRLKGTAA